MTSKGPFQPKPFCNPVVLIRGTPTKPVWLRNRGSGAQASKPRERKKGRQLKAPGDWFVPAAIPVSRKEPWWCRVGWCGQRVRGRDKGTLSHCAAASGVAAMPLDSL